MSMKLDDSAIFSGFLGLFIAIAVIVLAIVIFELIAMAKVFKKAGQPGWAAIVPYYNVYTLLTIVGYNWYYIFIFVAASFLSGVPGLGFLIGLVVFAFNITFNIKLAKSFGQSVGFGIGLLLASPIFLAIIAFSKDIKYVGPTVKGDIDFKDLF